MSAKLVVGVAGLAVIAAVALGGRSGELATDAQGRPTGDWRGYAELAAKRRIGSDMRAADGGTFAELRAYRQADPLKVAVCGTAAGRGPNGSPIGPHSFVALVTWEGVQPNGNLSASVEPYVDAGGREGPMVAQMRAARCREGGA